MNVVLKRILLVIVGVIAPAVAAAQDNLQTLVNRAADQANVQMTAGIWKAPLKIERALTLQGDNPEVCVLEITSDEPAITVTSDKPVVIESMTIKWQRGGGGHPQGPSSAVLVTGGNVTLRNCRIIALGNGELCPAAVTGIGSQIKLENCHTEGFEFTIACADGSEGSITDCVVLNPGHCGITVSSGSKIEVARTIVTGSKYHGLRSTGGILNAHDNLIIRNRNRGIYLGNKSSSGRVNNNVIMSNGTGIGAFARTNVAIENNLFIDCSYAGLGARDTCPIKVNNNIFQDNTQGIVVFVESGTNRVDVGQNSFWNNAANAVNFEMPSTAILVDPELAAPVEGNFAAQAGVLQDNRQGLSDAAVLRSVWEQWLPLRESVAVTAEQHVRLKSDSLQQLSEPTRTRNPFGVRDVRDPDGKEVAAFARRTTRVAKEDDPNSEQWVKEISEGKAGSIDGRWHGRWNSGTGSTWKHGRSAARIQTVENRVYILFEDQQTSYLIDTRREQDRLIGNWQNVNNPRDAGPAVFVIVDQQRIDGEWAQGRWDFRRRLK